MVIWTARPRTARAAPLRTRPLQTRDHGADPARVTTFPFSH